MKGYINVNKMHTISLGKKEGSAYIVLSDGRHRLGISCETEEEAEKRMLEMAICAKFGSGFYRIDQEIEEVRSYKPNSQKAK